LSLLGDIEHGKYAPDMRIPSEHELQAIYGVSRSTIREAVSQLVAAGLLRRQQGLGTFVQAPHIFESIGPITSFAEEVHKRGMAHDARILRCELAQPPRHVRVRLNLTAEQMTFILERLRCADGVNVALCTDYFPQDIAPSFREEDLVNQSLYRGLEQHYGIHLRSAEEEVEAVLPSRRAARLLEMPPRTPVLFLRRVTFGTMPDNRNLIFPVHYVETAYRADRFRYVAKLYERGS
jgi:GntR family transcriptional regulator